MLSKKPLEAIAEEDAFDLGLDLDLEMDLDLDMDMAELEELLDLEKVNLHRDPYHDLYYSKDIGFGYTQGMLAIPGVKDVYDKLNNSKSVRVTLKNGASMPFESFYNEYSRLVRLSYDALAWSDVYKASTVLPEAYSPQRSSVMSRSIKHPIDKKITMQDLDRSRLLLLGLLGRNNVMNPYAKNVILHHVCDSEMEARNRDKIRDPQIVSEISGDCKVRELYFKSEFYKMWYALNQMCEMDKNVIPVLKHIALKNEAVSAHLSIDGYSWLYNNGMIASDQVKLHGIVKKLIEHCVIEIEKTNGHEKTHVYILLHPSEMDESDRAMYIY